MYTVTQLTMEYDNHFRGSTSRSFQHHNKWLSMSHQFSICFALGMGKSYLVTEFKHNISAHLQEGQMSYFVKPTFNQTFN